MLQTIKKHQFLFEELVKRDFKIKYKGTVLGMAWSVISPLLQLLIMRVVFTHFFGSSVPHYTTYIFCGNIIYCYFNESTSQGMLSLVSNAPIFTKVNVPKYIFLLAKNAQTLLNFGLTACVFVVLSLFDGIYPTVKWFMLIYPIVMLVLFNLGCGLILSAAYVFFRDMEYLWGVFTQLLMWCSAIFYDISSFSIKVQNLYLLNPIYLYIRYFRKVVIDMDIPSFEFHILMMVETLVLLTMGSLMYKKYNTEFLYYV